MKLERVVDERVSRRFFLDAFTSGIVTLPFLIACSPQPVPKAPRRSPIGTRSNTQIQQPPQQSARTISPEQANIFPLEEGNSWEYRITVPEGVDYYTRMEFVSNGKGRTPGAAVGRLNKSSGAFALKYSLGMRVEERVKVHVEKDEMGFFRGSDAVYINVSSVGVAPNAGKSSYLRWEVFMDEPIINSKAFFLQLGLANTDEEMVVANNLDQAMFLITPDYRNPLEVKVAGGTFHDCVKQTITYHPENMFSGRERMMRERSRDSPTKTGWKEVGYFAPGIGLVKGAQYDVKSGRELSTTELVSYKVKGKN